MIQIRTGVFETNSSSTHSLTVCTEEDYKKFVNGELKIKYSGRICDKDEDGITYEEYASYEQERGETIIDEDFTSPSGDKIKVFGYFGHD